MAAVYVAVENSVTLLIGVRMGGGRMAGQDRSMLGGMKALILVRIPSSPLVFTGHYFETFCRNV